MSHRETFCGTELGPIRQVIPQHTPGMNEWCLVRLLIDHLFSLVFREEEKMGEFLFDVVVVVDQYFHENAAVEAEWASLFWFCEDVCPHDFGGAIYDFEVAVGKLVLYEEVSAFDVLCSFGAREGAVNLQTHC